MTNPVHFSLAGRRALVTGANTGLGQAIAIALAAAGADIVGAGRSAMAETETAVTALGRRFLAVTADLARMEAIEPLVEAASAEAGPIDILVNNAGVYEFAPLDGITPEHFHRQFDLNVLGLLLTSQETARHFNPNGGSIINISSGVSTIAPPNSAVYTATKASVDAITSVLAKELAPKKIRVNAVNPGMIVTEGVVSAGFHEGEMRNWIETATPMGRVGKAEEIAAVVAFLASDGASYVTGETLHVTGGLK